MRVKEMDAALYYQQVQQAAAKNDWDNVRDFARQCIDAHPDHEMLLNAKSFLAMSFAMLQQQERAIVLWQELEREKPTDINLLTNIGMAYLDCKIYDQAIEYFKRALVVMPNYGTAHLNLGVAFYKLGQLNQAKESNRQALIYDPRCIEARLNLITMLEEEGNFAESMKEYWQIIDLDSKNSQVIGHILHLNAYAYSDYKQDEVLWLYRRLVEQEIYPPTYNKTRFRRKASLHVGLVSADLRRHPVGFFLESLLKQLNSDPQLNRKILLTAYHNQNAPDEYTEHLKGYFDDWHDVYWWDDERLTNQVIKDGVDILIDLSGHTQGNRLPAFVRQPAPLQLSWLGYWGSTGLHSIDYIIADKICVPDTEKDQFVEKVWQLPHLRYCLSLPSRINVAELPCLSRKEITFGCYQRLIKISPSVLNCWSKILSAAPNTRLRVQAKNFDVIEVQEKFKASLEQVGIDLQRVELVTGGARGGYLESYSEVDIVLDTFPFTGGTTTAEALWMGVPTISLAEPTMLGRQGEALLVNAELSDWVAYSEEEYIAKAIEWGTADLEKRYELAKLRAGLREQVEQSPVFNAKQFAYEFVDALFAMWDEKCAEREHIPYSAAEICQRGIALIAEGNIAEVYKTSEQMIELHPSNSLAVEIALASMITMHLMDYPHDVKRYQRIMALYRQHYETAPQQRLNSKLMPLTMHTPLRVGFVSGDWNNHPVSFFMDSFLAIIRSTPQLASRLELLAYYNHDVYDEYTHRMRQYFDEWHSVSGWSDNRLMDHIASNRVDILIDLSGYTERNRLSLFAQRAASLQVSWLGYWNSTGLTHMDYILADPITVPANEENLFSEKVWHLPHLRYCFTKPEASDVTPPPCLKQSRFVFGCYQSLKKITSAVMPVWQRILASCPNAYFRLQISGLENQETKAQLEAFLTHFGIDLDRIEFVGKMSREEYLASYAEVDVILDTFPYTGGTTTAEALWMGVPTITLAAPGMLGRQGEALMINAGLSNWVAHSEEEYVQKAVEWAHADEAKRKSLAQLRANLREQVRQSPVFNAEQFAHEFVDGIYGMWQEKCLESVEKAR